jgi:4-amino-4-deoxy-L-arabinose transferase-like glycosyltransferase
VSPLRALLDRFVRAPVTSRIFSSERALVLFLVLVAGCLRLVHIADIPPGLQGDEAWMGLEAQRILREGWIGVWSTAGWGQPTGPFYWTAFLFSFLPDSTAVLRTAMALLGVATIPVLYLFVRTLYGRRAAVIGAFLLAFSYWHIHYSRTAFGLITAPLIECAVLLFIAMGMKRQRCWPFVVAGMLAGAGLYVYRGYIFFPLILVALWGAILLSRRDALRRLALYAALFSLSAALTAVPMLVTIAGNYDDYMGYGGEVSVFNTYRYQDSVRDRGALSFISRQGIRAIEVYFVGREFPYEAGPGSYRWYGADYTDGLGSMGLLDPTTAGLFALGLGISLWRWRRWQYFVVIAGVMVGIAVVTCTVEWGENRRGIIALPLVFAAVGIGGDAFVTFIARIHRRFQHVGSWILHGVWILFILFVILWNVVFYFAFISSSETTRFAYAHELSQVCAYVRSLEDPKPYVYFFSDSWSWDYEARLFQLPGVEGEDRSHKFGTFGLRLSQGHNRVLFLFMEPYQGQVLVAQSLYPGGQCVEEMEDGRLVFTGYLIDAP